MASESDIERQCTRPVLRPMTAEDVKQLEASIATTSLSESPLLRRVPFIQHYVDQPNATATEMGHREFEDLIRGYIWSGEIAAFARNPTAPFKLKETAIAYVAVQLTLSAIRDSRKGIRYVLGEEQDGLQLSIPSQAIYNVALVPQTLDERSTAAALNAILLQTEDIRNLPPDLRLLASKQHELQQMETALLTDFPKPGTAEFARMPREQRLEYDRRSFGLRALHSEGLEMAHQYIQARMRDIGSNATPAQVLQLATAAMAVGCQPAHGQEGVVATGHPSGINHGTIQTEVAVTTLLP